MIGIDSACGCEVRANTHDTPSEEEPLPASVSPRRQVRRDPRGWPVRSHNPDASRPVS